VKRENLARALARPDRLSRLEKEAIWQRVDTRLTAWWRRRVVWSSAGALAVAATVTIVMATKREPKETWQERGTSAVTLTLRCNPARSPGDCRRGDRLVFDFDAERDGYVALFARAPDGTVLWYVPGDGVLETAALLDARYVPGRYEVVVLLSERPLSRGDIKSFARDGQLVPPHDVRIATRVFVVAEEGP